MPSGQIVSVDTEVINTDSRLYADSLVFKRSGLARVTVVARSNFQAINGKENLVYS